MKYSNMMERAKLYNVPGGSKKLLRGIAKLEAELASRLERQRKNSEEIDKIARELGLLGKLRTVDKHISANAKEIFDAKKYIRSIKALRRYQKTPSGKGVSRELLNEHLPVLKSKREKLLSVKQEIQGAINLAANDAGLLEKKTELKKMASKARKTLGRARRTGQLPGAKSKSGKKRKSKSVRTISGGGVSPR